MTEIQNPDDVVRSVAATHAGQPADVVERVLAERFKDVLGADAVDQDRVRDAARAISEL